MNVLIKEFCVKYVFMAQVDLLCEDLDCTISLHTPMVPY